MKMTSSDPAARNLLIVDPHGVQIQHVQSFDTSSGEVTVIMTTHAQIPMYRVVNGVNTEFWYTFLQTQTPFMNGGRKFMDTVLRCAFDVVNKNTGEILAESRRYPEGPGQRFTDPGAYWDAWAQENGFSRR